MSVRDPFTESGMPGPHSGHGHGTRAEVRACNVAQRVLAFGDRQTKTIVTVNPHGARVWVETTARAVVVR